LGGILQDIGDTEVTCIITVSQMIHDHDLILCGKLIELPDCHILRGKDSRLGILDSYTTDFRMGSYQTVHDTSTARSFVATKDDEVIRDAEDNLLDPYTYST